MYWFYMLKSVDGYETINLENDVFIANSRDEAKRMITEKFGMMPFRKPKNAPDGTKYIYLTESNAFWYDYHHKELSYSCSWCSKSVTVIGEKNMVKNSRGVYCSSQCKELQEKDAKKEWINQVDHVGLNGLDESELAGYIYKITNKRTMKAYVGQTVNPALFRWWQHLKNDKKFEQADITELVFEVLEIVEYHEKFDGLYQNAKNKLNKREAHYIRLYGCVDDGYNSIQPKELEYDLFSIEHAK